MKCLLLWEVFSIQVSGKLPTVWKKGFLQKWFLLHSEIKGRTARKVRSEGTEAWVKCYKFSKRVGIAGLHGKTLPCEAGSVSAAHLPHHGQPCACCSLLWSFWQILGALRWPFCGPLQSLQWWKIILSQLFFPDINNTHTSSIIVKYWDHQMPFSRKSNSSFLSYLDGEDSIVK